MVQLSRIAEEEQCLPIQAVQRRAQIQMTSPIEKQKKVMVLTRIQDQALLLNHDDRHCHRIHSSESVQELSALLANLLENIRCVCCWYRNIAMALQIYKILDFDSEKLQTLATVDLQIRQHSGCNCSLWSTSSMEFPFLEIVLSEE
jgi:hypothetical protein